MQKEIFIPRNLKPSEFNTNATALTVLKAGVRKEYLGFFGRPILNVPEILVRNSEIGLIVVDGMTRTTVATLRNVCVPGLLLNSLGEIDEIPEKLLNGRKRDFFKQLYERAPEKSKRQPNTTFDDLANQLLFLLNNGTFGNWR